MTQFDAEPDLAPVATRTSALAVTSIVMSLICCIPGLPAIGALLGVGGVMATSKSDGHVKGRGLAIAGVVIGLIFTLLQIGAVYGVAWAARNMGEYGQIMAAIDAGDRQALAPWLDGATDASLTDAQIQQFKDAVEAEYGAFVRAPSGFRDYINLYGQVSMSLQTGQQAAMNAGHTGPVIPVPVQMDQGVAPMIIMGSQPPPQAPNQFPPASNIGIVKGDGSMIWLVDPAQSP